MKIYKSGRAYEYKARKILEREGFYVIRSAGSRGIIDLVAIKPNKIKLIQVKSTSRDEIKIPNELKEFAKKYSNQMVEVELWVFKKGKKLEKIKLGYSSYR